MGKVCLEYIWIGGNNEMRSKTKVFDINNEEQLEKIMNPENLPIWNYDGSSTEQADGNDSEVGNIVKVKIKINLFFIDTHIYRSFTSVTIL